MKRLYNALFGGGCYPFESLLDKGCEDNITIVRDQEELKETDAALVVWGGADINPDYYGHPRHRTTHPGGERDRLEWSLMTRAMEMGIAIIGVCRGAQMVCARAGGWLIQDVRNHGGYHFCETQDGLRFMTNSIHHQMMAGLNKVDHELVAWCAEARSKGQYGFKDDQWYIPGDDFKEPEFVFFPKIRAYAIQWHPEGMDENSPATQYVLNYIKQKEAKLNESFATATIITE